MELAHAHRDQLTRDFHNKIDHHRQRDSGLRGMLQRSLPKSLMDDPVGTAHKWRQQLVQLVLCHLQAVVRFNSINWIDVDVFLWAWGI